MASENKKRKGKNSFLCNRGEKTGDMKMKRICFYGKQARQTNKKIAVEEY